jgi:NADH dehydrogenase FAD-containing subunit
MRAPTGTAPERMAFYQRFRERLAASQRILIIGGGPIGIEVAGEITQEYPSKSVTIVEAGERVLGGTSRKMADHATAVLEKRGVRIFTGERLKGAGSASGDVFAPGGEAHTESGRVLPYDLAIWCVGGRPNTDYMEQYFAHVLDHDRRIQVTPQLRVKGYDRLFALGDITDLAENKMAWHVAGQVDCAAINVRRVLAGRTSADQLQSYRPQTGNPAMVVTLGRRAGVICLPRIGMVKAGWFNRKVKAAHMLVPKYRKLLGV